MYWVAVLENNWAGETGERLLVSCVYRHSSQPTNQNKKKIGFLWEPGTLLTVQCSTVQYSTVQYSTDEYSTTVHCSLYYMNVSGMLTIIYSSMAPVLLLSSMKACSQVSQPFWKCKKKVSLMQIVRCGVKLYDKVIKLIQIQRGCSR